MGGSLSRCISACFRRPAVETARVEKDQVPVKRKKHGRKFCKKDVYLKKESVTSVSYNPVLSFVCFKIQIDLFYCNRALTEFSILGRILVKNYTKLNWYKLSLQLTSRFLIFHF